MKATPSPRPSAGAAPSVVAAPPVASAGSALASLLDEFGGGKGTKTCAIAEARAPCRLEQVAAYPANELLRLLPDGRWLDMRRVGEDDGEMLLVQNGEEIASLPADYSRWRPRPLTVLSDGLQLLVAKDSVGHAEVDLLDFERAETHPIASSTTPKLRMGGLRPNFKGPSFFGLAATSEGRRFALAMSDQVSVFELCEAETQPIAVLQWQAPRRTQAATMAWNNRATILQVGEELFDFEAETRCTLALTGSIVTPAQFSPDDRFVTFGTSLGEIVRFDLSEPLPRSGSRYPDQVAVVSRGAVLSQVMSPDGQTLAVAGADRTLRLLDATSLSPVTEGAETPHYDELLALSWVAQDILRVGYRDNGVVDFKVASEERIKQPPSFAELQKRLPSRAPKPAKFGRWDGQQFDHKTRPAGLSIRLPNAEAGRSQGPILRFDPTAHLLRCEGLKLLFSLSPEGLYEAEAPMLKADCSDTTDNGVTLRRGLPADHLVDIHGDADGFEGRADVRSLGSKGSCVASDLGFRVVGAHGAPGFTVDAPRKLHVVHAETGHAISFDFNDKPLLLSRLHNPKAEQAEPIEIKTNARGKVMGAKIGAWNLAGSEFFAITIDEDLSRVALDGTVLASVPAPKGAVCLSASDDARVLVVGTEDGDVVMLDVATLEVQTTLKVHDAPLSQAFVHEGVLFSSGAGGWVGRDVLR